MSVYYNGNLIAGVPEIDSGLSLSSDNPVKNKTVTAALNAKQDALTIDTSSLSNDSTHVPASSVVKSAINDVTDYAGLTGFTIKKVGRVVSIYCEKTNLTVNPWSGIAALPSGFRPLVYVSTMARKPKNVGVVIEPSNGVIAVDTAISNSELDFFVTYLA